MSDDPFAPLKNDATSQKRADRINKPRFSVVLPVPADAPPPPQNHPQLGKPSLMFAYLDTQRKLLGFECRFDLEDGTKEFRPLVLFRSEEGCSLVWRWESWPPPRPLYGLDRLAGKSQSCIIIICEGAKAADAAQRLLPNYVCMTSPNGAKSASKADWTPLRGKQVIFWPDLDEAGATYVCDVAKLLHETGAASVSVIDVASAVKRVKPTHG